MSKLIEKIAEEIKKKGIIPFARFMELALYCPVYGYYDKETDRLGRRGDYFTSVSVGSLFGELLACQFAQWLDGDESKVQRPKAKVQTADRPQVVEAGAHRGALAKDILAWMRASRPGLFERLEYWIVEPSERQRQWQQESLAEFGERVHWVKELSELATVLASSKRSGSGHPSSLRPPHSNGVTGIIFSNELLDAFPMHRLGWDAKRRGWFEWGVTMEGGRFVWTKGLRVHSPRPKFQGSDLTKQNLGAEHAFDALEAWDLPDELLEVMPDGFTVEVCPSALAWWREAARRLSRGKLMTIDYGFSTEEWLRPERKEGTLRAYYQHRLVSDLLAQPGQQDLTAHINFSAIQAAGESAGLTTELFLTQARFLTRIAGSVWSSDLRFGEWTTERTRQFQTLTHPDHLGRAFRVLVQSR